MAALLAYLLSIAIFLGASYAGLVWLTEPPAKTSTPHAAKVQTGGAPGTKAPASEHRANVEKPPANSQGTPGKLGPVESAGPAKGDPSTMGKAGNDNSGSAAARNPEIKQAEVKPADTKQADAKPVDTASTPSSPASSKEQSQLGNPPRADAKSGGDGVPPGGCMPIGMTAQGDLVFPMQCRDLLQQSAQPADPPSPTRQAERTKSASQEPALPSPEPAKPQSESGNGGGNSAPAIANRAQPPSTRTTDLDSRAESNSAPRSSVAREVLRRKKVATRKPDQSPPPKAATDSHGDDHPSPPNRSGNMASRSDDWFNPLGFR